MSAYNELLKAVSETLESHKRIPNVLSLIDNKSNFISKGYGVKVGSVTNSSDDSYCEHYLNRAFTVVLTSLVTRLDSDEKPFDDAANELIEAANKIAKKIKDDNFITRGQHVARIELNDIGAIDFIGDKFTYLTIEINVSITTKE